MKISIILPVYNAALYIKECILSIIQQTYKNYELIIIDDCSKDNSIDIIFGILEEHKYIPVKFIRNKTNLGISATRNIGIKESCGDFIFFIDSDDFISKDCLKSFTTLLNKYPSVDIISGSYINYPLKQNQNAIQYNGIPEFINDKKQISLLFYNKKLPNTVWNKLFKKDFIEKYNLSFKEGIVYEDDLWHFITAKYCTRIAFNQNFTYYYRYNPTSIIHNYGEKEMRSETVLIKECFKNITCFCFFHQIKYIAHLTHYIYCKRAYINNKDISVNYKHYLNILSFLFQCLTKRTQ